LLTINNPQPEGRPSEEGLPSGLAAALGQLKIVDSQVKFWVDANAALHAASFH
jgi:hypothetical protein